MSHSNSLFLGQGWSFPPTFNDDEKNVDIVHFEDDIQQSLMIILSTNPGERIMHPTFGCGLKLMVFDTLTESTVTEIIDLVERAILFFETRITLNEVTVNVDDYHEGRIDILLDYTIRTINTRSNMVYPFYYSEGTDVQML
jgi:phage baseplate assembly protein W